MDLLILLQEVLLVGHRKQRLEIGILSGLPPVVQLLREQTPLPAVATQFRRIQASGLRQPRELVGRAPTLWIFLRGRNNLSLEAPGLEPL